MISLPFFKMMRVATGPEEGLVSNAASEKVRHLLRGCLRLTFCVRALGHLPGVVMTPVEDVARREA
jgi:hypothetical protein